MCSDIFYNMITEKINTIEEKKQLASFLEEFQRVCFNEKITLEDFIESHASQNLKQELMAYLIQKNGTDRQAISEKVHLLIGELKDIPVIHLTLAFDADFEAKVRLTQFIRNTMKETVLVDFLKNEGIGGGAIIEGKERIGTYTLMEYFEAKSVEK